MFFKESLNLLKRKFIERKKSKKMAETFSAHQYAQKRNVLNWSDQNSSYIMRDIIIEIYL
ncbi:MAG: hypothetical protein CMH46_11520 [Muricauda sp.]|nr:hypothetical protein [Allomuricauda sp.]